MIHTIEYPERHKFVWLHFHDKSTMIGYWDNFSWFSLGIVHKNSEPFANKLTPATVIGWSEIRPADESK